MPTGGGKSLCYQIPGIIFNGLTVVISPLIALMKDQVDDANSKGIKAAFLNSSLSSSDIADIYNRLFNNEIKILYISPERLAIQGHLEKFKEFNVQFFAIDEAHCLSEWGHDFRPDYLYLKNIRDVFPSTPIAAFTATATKKVQKDIIELLQLKSPLTIRASFNRKELFYEVRPKSDILNQIYSYIKTHINDSGIVYRVSRKDVEITTEYLTKKGIKALPYHAGLNRDKRTEYQDSFNRDHVNVIVATTAFGMGINKSNIRYVIHGDLPKSMEGYYQETGRAGRDGLDSSCVLFFGTGDIAKQQFFINQIQDNTEQTKNRENLNKIVKFSTVNVCRRKQILEYFDEDYNDNCNNCDICTTPENKVEATVDAQKVLSAIIRTNQSFGINHIIDIVRGSDNQKIRDRNHHTLKTYGIGKDKNRNWWRSIINELLGQSIVFQDFDNYNILKFGTYAEDILFGRKKFFISETSAINREDKIEKKRSTFDSNLIDKVLLQKLKDVRTNIARESNVPPYIIFSDKTLMEMAIMKPETSEEFLSVSGVGEKKLEVYGSLFLATVRTHLSESE